MLIGLRTRRTDPARPVLLAGAGVTALYLASVAIATVFKHGATVAPGTVLDLTVHQEGQVLLSALWGTVGLAMLIVSLRRNMTPTLSAALALLLVTVAKVFLFDLSTLTSYYRVASFFVLGALLLAGGFAYQRLRPPPPPDLRSLHHTQR